MDTLSAFGMGEANRGREAMVFDWEEAERRIKASGTQNATAGLRGDWEWTGGPILENGRRLSADESYTYLASTWAEPELDLCQGDGPEPCYRMRSQTPGWGATTRWPQGGAE